MRLSAKFLGITIPLIVIPMTVVGWFSYQTLLTQLEQTFQEQLHSSLERNQRQVTNYFQSVEADVELFSNDPNFQRYMQVEDEELRYTIFQKNIIDLFTGYRHANPHYYEIKILLPDGYEDTRLASPHLNNITEEESETTYFQEILRTPEKLYSTTFLNPDNQEFSFLVSKRIELVDIEREGPGSPPKLRGYLMITANLNLLTQHIMTQRIGKQGIFLFTDNEGKILLHPNAQEVNQQLPPDLFSQIQKLSDGDVLKTGYKGEEVYFLGKSVHSKLFLISIFPESEVFAGSRELMIAIASITFLSILFTIALVYGAVHYFLLLPIHQLRNATLALRDGNLDLQLKLKTHDEIGQLATEFQKTIHALKLAKEQRDQSEQARLEGQLELQKTIFARDFLEKEKTVIQEAKDAAELANRAKSQFLANMSHEIRTPLNAIIGFGQILLNRASKLSLPEDFIQYLQNIHLSGRNLSELINNILDLTKIESDNMEVSIEGVAIKQLLLEVYEIIRVQAVLKHQNCSLQISPNLPHIIATDRAKLTQVLINILGNAIKFSPNKGDIQLTATKQEGLIEIRVIDHGIGIPKDKQRSIFEAFEQVDGTITRRFGGTGIGLSISEKLIDLLQGSIEVNETLGGGSTFIIKIPAIEIVPSQEQTLQKIKNIAFDQESIVLLVEDNLMNQAMTQALFEEIGLSLYIAQNGKEGIEKALHLKPDLVLMDMHMPIMGGLEATRQILSNPELEDTPIVALSADAFAEQQKKALSLGMKDYLIKPIEMGKFLPILKKYLRYEIKEDLLQKEEIPDQSIKNNEPSLDTKVLAQLKPQLRDRFISMFLDQITQTLEKITHYLEIDNLPGLCEEMHHLKGSCLTIGANHMAQICDELQVMGKRGDLADIKTVIEQLKQSYEQIKQTLEEISFES